MPPFVCRLARGVRESVEHSSCGSIGAAATRGSASQDRRFAQRLAAEIVFTSGGTESNNLAILGLLRGLPKPLHAVTLAIEHPAVLEPFRQLESEGVEVSYVKSAEAVGAALRDDTALVSVMHANNETGAIQPLEEIASLITERRDAGQTDLSSFGRCAGIRENSGRSVAHEGRSLLAERAQDFWTEGHWSAFRRKNTPLRRIQFGGRHERERRPGTENVPSAMAFAQAAELAAGSPGEIVAGLRDWFEAQLLERLTDIQINGSQSARLPNTSNILFRGVSAEALVIALDMRQMAVSTGAACSSGSLEPSHVLLAMGLTRDEARSSIRFSFGRYNTFPK